MPDSSAPDQGQVHVSVECSSCASPEFKGRGGEDWGIDLAQALEASLVGSPAAGGCKRVFCLAEKRPRAAVTTRGSCGASVVSCVTSAVGVVAAGGSLDLKSLCVLPGKTCWVVYVDALLLNDGGNVLDALSIAVRAALALTRIPKVRARRHGVFLGGLPRAHVCLQWGWWQVVAAGAAALSEWTHLAAARAGAWLSGGQANMAASPVCVCVCASIDPTQ